MRFQRREALEVVTAVLQAGQAIQLPVEQALLSGTRRDRSLQLLEPSVALLPRLVPGEDCLRQLGLDPRPLSDPRLEVAQLAVAREVRLELRAGLARRFEDPQHGVGIWLLSPWLVEPFQEREVGRLGSLSLLFAADSDPLSDRFKDRHRAPPRGSRPRARLGDGR